MPKTRSILAYGKPGSTKTTFATSIPGLKWWAEFDINSLSRSGLSPDDPQLDFHKYYPPLEAMLDMGQLARDSKGQVLPSNNPTAGGFMAKVMEFRNDLLAALSEPSRYSSVVYDTGSRQWDLIISARDEEVRSAKLNDDRLGQLKFTETNRWMRGFIMSPKAVGLNLCIVEQEEEPFNQPGVWRPKGFKEVESDMDAVLHFSVEDKTPWATLEKTAGGSLTLRGMRIKEPTWVKVVGLLDAAEMIRGSGLTMPTDYDAVVKLAGEL